MKEGKRKLNKAKNCPIGTILRQIPGKKTQGIFSKGKNSWKGYQGWTSLNV